jgi:glycosyltransferase involved in cell wall biosynthesis
LKDGPLSILAVTLRYPPYVAGGYELLTRDAVEELAARGHRVTVLCAKGARLEGVAGVLPWLEPGLDGEDDLFRRSFEASNAERFRLHFFRLANYRATRRAVGEVEPDVLLFFNLGLVSLAPLVAARHLDLPTLGVISDVWPANHWILAWRENERSARGKSARLAALTSAWRGFRRLVSLGPMIVPSRFLRERLIAEGIPPADLEVVSHGLPPDMEQRTRSLAPARREAGGPLLVACTSSLWKGKGQDVLLRAVSLARAGGAPIEVVLAFAGADDGFRAELEALARSADLDGAVRFAGRLERPELSELLTRAHVLALPSVWGEPFGLATLEGMAHGLAVVVSDAGASPELVEDGESGLVVPAGDERELAAALARLERDEELRLALAGCGRERLRSAHAHARFADGLERGLRRAAATRPR